MQHIAQHCWENRCDKQRRSFFNPASFFKPIENVSFESGYISLVTKLKFYVKSTSSPARH